VGEGSVVTVSSSRWDSVYRTRPIDQVSWYQREPTVSLRLVTSNAVPGAAVIDVGAGASLLVDHLLTLGYRNVTLLDVSRTALSQVRSRLGSLAENVAFVVGDVLEWSPDCRYDLWHDRAVFHFLNEPVDQGRYVALAARALCPGGVLVLGVYGTDGPTHCSGLEVQRFSSDDLERVFSSDFVLEHTEHEQHVTPDGIAQSFIWAVLRRRES